MVRLVFATSTVVRPGVEREVHNGIEPIDIAFVAATVAIA